MAKILIVDWDEIERVNLWSILEDEGYELLFASDGNAALKVWEEKTIDVVITELAMPELNGLRLIQALVERDPGVRILAISAISADQLDLAEDFGAGAILYKPVEPQALLSAVKELMEGPRSRSDRWKWA
jgi:CheY-like chemotaxis protein